MRRFILVQCKIKKMSAAILGYGLASILADINLTWPVPLKGHFGLTSPMVQTLSFIVTAQQQPQPQQQNNHNCSWVETK